MTGVQTCALRSEEHTSELQSHDNVVCRLLLEKNNDTEAAEHLGQPGMLGEHAQARLADPAYAGNGTFTVAAVLQLDVQFFFNYALDPADLHFSHAPLLPE